MILFYNMIWKELPIWLKGGIIGIVLGIIMFSSYYYACGFGSIMFPQTINPVCKSLYLISIPNTLIYAKFLIPRLHDSFNAQPSSGTPAEGLINLNENLRSDVVLGQIILLISFIMIYFLLGALIGLIIEKIKK